MDQVLIQQLANELLVAEDTATPILPLTDRYPDITIQDAYAIQKAVIDLKLARGEVVIGKKIGLTSKGIRDQVGVHEPDYGVMTDAGWVKDGECIDAGKMICPRIEAEIVFVLKRIWTKRSSRLGTSSTRPQALCPRLRSSTAESRTGASRSRIPSLMRLPTPVSSPAAIVSFPSTIWICP